MTRSFTDRVLGGVCGGLSTRLPLNAWGVRLLFLFSTIATLGLMIPIYALLWFLLPQESLIAPKRIGFLRFIGLVMLIGLCAVGWWMFITQAYTPLIAQIPAGISDFIVRALPVLLVLIGLGFLLRGRIPLGNMLSLILSIALVGGVASIAYSGKSAQLSTAQTVALDYPIADEVIRLVVNVSGRTSDITITTAPNLRVVTGTFVGSQQSIITQTKNVSELGDGEMTITETLSPDFPRLDDLGRGEMTITLPADMPLVLNIVNYAGDVSLSLGDAHLERLTLDVKQGDAVVALPNYNPVSVRSEEVPSKFIIANGNLTLLIPSAVDARLIYSASNLAEAPDIYIESREAGLTILRPNPDRFTTENAPRLFYEIDVRGALRVQLREDN